MAFGPVSTEWTGILGTVGNKETYSVDILLATFLAKNDRPQNGRLRDGIDKTLNYRIFPA
jgi:hypothetical protein